MMLLSRCFACTSLLLALHAPLAPAQSPQIHEAVMDGKSGEILFDPFQPVDWRQLAQRDMKDFNLQAPAPAQVERLKKQLREHPDDETGTNEEAHFMSPIEKPLSSGYYYLLSSTGLQPLQPLRLAGSMRYRLNAGKTAIVPETFYGQIAAKTSGPSAKDGAFVVFSDSPLAFAAISAGKFSAHKEARQDLYEYAREGRNWKLSVPDEGGLFDVMTSVSFKMGESEYIYVHWKPDTQNYYGGCDRQFTLFKLDRELKLVLSARSGCDV
jgi:hypothetical protein